MAIQFRKNISSLSIAELATLRAGFEKLYTYPPDDNRGFSFLAGMHGHPQFLCPHHLADFLPWHRAYLRVFERALQRAADDSTLMLPYWDWSAPRSRNIPGSVSVARYRSARVMKPNPLHHSTIPYEGVRDTTRSPAGSQVLTRIAAIGRAALLEPSFTRFQTAIENAHDGLHGYVGGDMGVITWAAFDPIFWLHHSNVDRLWAQWQSTHPGARLPAQVENNVLRGFRVRGRDVLDTEALDYAYATSSASAVLDPGAGLDVAPMTQQFVVPKSTVSRAVITLLGVAPPHDSLEVRVYIGGRGASASTTPADRRYAGSMFVFGHGSCTGVDAGHCDWEERVDDTLLGPHHLAPFDSELDVTEAVRRAVAGASGADAKVNVSVQVSDLAGDTLSVATLSFSELRLVTEE